MLCKKRTKQVLSIAFLALVAVLVGLYWLGRIVNRAGPAARTAGKIRAVIAGYIQKNNGCFPASEAHLERQSLIRRFSDGDSNEYYMTSAPFGRQDPCDWERWIRLWDFELFKIRYGAQAEDFEVIDGKLYDKSSNEKVLLIDGPYGKYLTPQYRRISVMWFELMLKEKEEAAVNSAQKIP